MSIKFDPSEAIIAENTSETLEVLEAVKRLTADIKSAALTLSQDEVRFLVNTYYTMQRARIRAVHQKRQLEEQSKPHLVIAWLADQQEMLENQVKNVLDAYTAADELGSWSREVCGIGPVIAAGLLAHIKLERASSPAKIWRYAGLDPTVTWGKGEKMPWNAKLKRLCFLIGESFVKVQANENDVYGKVYAKRKLYEQQKNENGDYSAQAAAALKAKNYGDETKAKEWYLQGKLPPARIHRRAARYAVKLFLSHWWTVGKTLRGEPVPAPYAIAHLGHVDYIPPPHFADGKKVARPKAAGKKISSDSVRPKTHAERTIAEKPVAFKRAKKK